MIQENSTRKNVLDSGAWSEYKMSTAQLATNQKQVAH